MPYPTHVTHEALLAQACALIEAQGVEQFSLAAVAGALGVKTPSLYRHVSGKTDLLRQVNLAFLEGLLAALAAADAAESPQAGLLAVLEAYRAYAHAHPRTYLMAFAYKTDELRPDEDLLVRMVLPLQAAMAAVAGEEASLAALRGALALAHGWVMLELTDQLRRGGDLGAHFRRAAEAYLAGWASDQADAAAGGK